MRRPFILVLSLAAIAAALSSPAVAGPQNPDPYERFNRRNFTLSLKLDKILISPLARLTKGLTPGPISGAIHNILRTLNEPVVILNNILQVRPRGAVKSAARLAVNVTVGLLGAVDVAKKLGLPFRPNGFGDTLGRYRVGPGPYLFLPLLGPSDLRDLLGTGVDTFTTPVSFVKYAYKTEVVVTLNVVGGLDTRAEAEGDLKTLFADAADPYATLRSTYLQARQGQIDEGRAPSALPDIGGVDPQLGAPATSRGPAVLPEIPDEPAPAAAPLSAPHAALDSSGPRQGGLAVDQAGAFEALPDQQRGHADDKVTPALEQRQGEGEIGSQAE